MRAHTLTKIAWITRYTTAARISNVLEFPVDQELSVSVANPT